MTTTPIDINKFLSSLQSNDTNTADVSRKAAADFAAFFSDRPRPVPHVPEPLQKLPPVIYMPGPKA